MTKIDIFKIGCGKFIIGKNALSFLEDLVAEFGNKPYIIGGTIGINLIKEHLKNLPNAVIREHTGACSQNIGSKFAEEATSQEFSVIIGVGGGKIIDLAKELILGTNKNVSQIAYELGFQYPQHFNRIFKKTVGYTPNEYRKLRV